MAMLVAGPSPLSVCKPYYKNHAHISYSAHQIISHSNHKWVASYLPLLKNLNRPLYTCGLDLLTPWDSHAHLGQSFLLNGLHKGFRRKGKRRFVQASLFGVGAPEALVIGVVALLVFGPKGLAEVARTLGRSLRAFQPTIRELQEVSRDFKNTLEQEIGLDDIRASIVEPSKPTSKTVEGENLEQNGPPMAKELSSEDQVEALVLDDKPKQSDEPPVSGAFSSEVSLQVTEDQIKTLVPEEKPKESNERSIAQASSSEDYLKVTEDHIKTLVQTDKLKDSTEEGAELGSSSSTSILSQEISKDEKSNNGKVV